MMRGRFARARRRRRRDLDRGLAGRAERASPRPGRGRAVERQGRRRRGREASPRGRDRRGVRRRRARVPARRRAPAWGSPASTVRTTSGCSAEWAEAGKWAEPARPGQRRRPRRRGRHAGGLGRRRDRRHRLDRRRPRPPDGRKSPGGGLGASDRRRGECLRRRPRRASAGRPACRRTRVPTVSPDPLTEHLCHALGIPGPEPDRHGPLRAGLRPHQDRRAGPGGPRRGRGGSRSPRSCSGPPASNWPRWPSPPP